MPLRTTGIIDDGAGLSPIATLPLCKSPVRLVAGYNTLVSACAV